MHDAESEVLEAFNHPSDSYGSGGDFHERYAQALVTAARLRPGDTVLDVATGTAPAAIAAARAIGPRGHVVGIDAAPGMLDLARRVIPPALVDQIELLRGDAVRIPFPAEHFDAVLCSSSLAWFPNISAAVREWARVMKPGGRLAFSTFSRSAFPLGSLLRTHLAGFGVEFPDLNAPLNTPEKCRRLLGTAGFEADEIITQRYPAAVSDPDGAWRASGGAWLEPGDDESGEWAMLRANPMVLWARVRRQVPIRIPLDPDQLRRLKQDFLQEVAFLATGGGIQNPILTMLVLAHRNR